MNNAITGARHELCKRAMESRIGREIVGRAKERMRGRTKDNESEIRIER